MLDQETVVSHAEPSLASGARIMQRTECHQLDKEVWHDDSSSHDHQAG
ncbi:hypothetical protein CFBP7900_05750 [Xanthomonas hortorum pv. carotae]|uniref:Uncharacterized protein n=1 Tax=Xanthomonas hortorum pv. carotae TaxID=487904 RepID=A0A6V7C0K8_9XANT|nr:hypothetical protein CFBP7900_05750 [Xanthomonas hortorum pv. carotae]CAD0307651.1 hypothetical protein CFBP7900_05750 [Xanthomonas hortorum pv. carotae]